MRHVARIVASLCFNGALPVLLRVHRAPRCATSQTLVVSPGGWTTRATIHEVRPSPGGTSERIPRSQSYNFKNGADNETEEQRKSREAVKRNAKRRATDRFDEEKTEAKKSQRRKGAALTPAPLAITAGSPAVAAPLTPFAAIPTPSPPTASKEQDLKTRRDLAILRGFLHLPDAVAVLESIQTAGLDDDEDPFTVRGVRERHALLCRSVRIATRLVGGMGSSVGDGMSELGILCR